MSAETLILSLRTEVPTVVFAVAAPLDEAGRFASVLAAALRVSWGAMRAGCQRD